MPDFKSLRVTPLIRAAVSDTYRITASFPDCERYGLASQMRRAAVSIGANVAEGTGRSSDGDFARFVQIARGSSHELEYHILVASDLGMLEPPQATELLEKIRKISAMLYALAKRLKKSYKPEAEC